MSLYEVYRCIFFPWLFLLLILISPHSVLSKINLEHKYSILHEIGICSISLSRFMAVTMYSEFCVNQRHTIYYERIKYAFILLVDSKYLIPSAFFAWYPFVDVHTSTQTYKSIEEAVTFLLGKCVHDVKGFFFCCW